MGSGAGEGAAVSQVEGAGGCVREDPEVRESLALGAMDRRPEWLEGGVREQEGTGDLEFAGSCRAALAGGRHSCPFEAFRLGGLKAPGSPQATTASSPPLWFSLSWGMREPFSRNLGFFFVGDAVVCCPCAPPGMTDSFPKLSRCHGQRSQLSASLGISRGFPGGSDGEESACNAGDPGSMPGSGRSPGERHGYSL